MTKLIVATDRSGNIIATAQSVKAGKDAPTGLQLRPHGDQQIHQIDVADNLAAVDQVHKLHATHRVEVKGGVATLVEHTRK